MKKQITTILLTAALVISSVCPVFAASTQIKTTEDAHYEEEDNGSRKTATTIFPTLDYFGVLETEKDADYYRFVAPKKGTYRIYFADYSSQEIGEGWDIYVLNSKGKKMKNKLSKGVQISSSIGVSLKKKQEIYIKVCSDAGEVAGADYIIKVVEK
ncbi:MAG: hypothetical protein K6B14_01590 [Lachnospiraceae bacterium]|nr:hypothetical protein [Lachnospiraceae bacterium]